jgi:hypothetical protein
MLQTGESPSVITRGLSAVEFGAHPRLEIGH